MHEQNKKYNTKIATIKKQTNKNPRVEKYKNQTEEFDREFQK